MSFLNKVGKFGERVVDSASKTAGNIADKSKTTAEKIKLKRQIDSENAKIARQMSEIGKKFYQMNNDNIPEGYEEYFYAISHSKSQIEKLKLMIEEINNANICQSCGGKINKAQEFCHLCGARNLNADIVEDSKTVEPTHTVSESKSDEEDKQQEDVVISVVDDEIKDDIKTE